MPRRLWTQQHPPLDGPFVVNRRSPQASGLRWWLPDVRRNNPFGTTLVSSVNTSNTIVSDGALGQVYNLPAGYVECTGLGNGVPQLNNDWSIACWVNFNATTSGQTILAISQVAGSNVSTLLSLRPNIQCEHSGAGTIVDSGISATIGVWYRVWYTFRATSVGNGVSTIYVNGWQKAQNASVPSQNATPDTMNLGRYHDAAFTGDVLNGKMVDARYYVVAVQPEVIWHDYDPATRYDLWLPTTPRRWWAVTVNPYIPQPDPIFVQRRL